METAGVLPISCWIYIISVKRRWLYFRLSELRKKFPFYRPMFVKPCCTTRLLGDVKPGSHLTLGLGTARYQSFYQRNPPPNSRNFNDGIKKLHWDLQSEVRPRAITSVSVSRG